MAKQLLLNMSNTRRIVTGEIFAHYFFKRFLAQQHLTECCITSFPLTICVPPHIALLHKQHQKQEVKRAHR